MKASENQQEILNCNGKENLIVEAVAGSGKTTTIKMCIESNPSKKQLYLVFNKSMQEEAQAKFKKSGLTSKVTVSTIHSYCRQIFAESIAPNVIKNGESQTNKYKEIFRDVASSMQGIAPYIEIRKVLRSVWSIIQNTAMIPAVNKEKNRYEFDWGEIAKKINLYNLRIGQEMETEINGKKVSRWNIKYFNEVLTALHFIYEKSIYLAEYGIITFDDMIWLPLQPKFNADFSCDYDVIYVDESQDLNLTQISIIENIAKANTNTKFVFVGDSRQAIYGFRMALPDSMRQIKQKFSCKELPLSVCYRCPKKVVELASDIVPQIKYGANAIEGSIIDLIEDEVLREVKESKEMDFLIVCRLNAPLLGMYYDFLKDESIKSKLKDKDKKLRKSLFSHIDSITNFNDAYNLSTFKKDANDYYVSKKGVLMQDDNDDELTSFEDEIACLAIFYKFFKAYVLKKEIFANELKDYISGRLDARKGAKCKGKKYVELNTIHGVKGSEADNVFILKHNEMPFKFKNACAWQYEQEENLLYVAITRAMKNLYLVESSPR
jgi:superfamily I DNA/RNA helicase